MSADALQSAIDILRKDDHVIVVTESEWYDDLQATICQANKTPKSEAPYYASFARILGTYASTCSHPNLAVAVTPQGRFEAMMDLSPDLSPQVKRQASDFSLTVVLKDSDSPEEEKVRLGGWLEAKPKDRSYAKKAAKDGKGNADVNADPGKRKDIDGQGKAEEIDADDKGKEEDADVEEDGDMEDEGEDMEDEGEDTEGEVEETEDEVEETEDEDEEIEDDSEDIEDEEVEVEDREMNAEDEVEGTDDSGEAGPEDEADPMITAGDTDPETMADNTKEDRSSKEMIQRLVANLPQLCKQAHHAFHDYPEDVIHALLTYGMRFSCFRFTRPANWDSVQGTGELKHTLPEPVFSDEDILIDGRLNPHFKQALHLLTASLGLSYQPSWFQLPSDYQVGTPNLTVANTALKRYKAKLKGDPTSPPMKTPPSRVKSPDYKPTAKEAAASVKKLRPELRSGKGGHVTPKAGVEPAENEATETSEPAHEEEVRADPESSDTDESPLNHRLRPKSTRSGPATSDISGAAGPSTKDPRTLAGDARTPAFKALVSGIKSKNKFITPKKSGKRTSKARGKARQQEYTNLRTESDGPALPALLPTLINDALIGDGLGDSGSQVLGHPPTSQAATGDNSRTGAPSRAKSGKRKGRPSSPLEADSPTPDPAEDSALALAGPSKKRRLVPQADQQPVDDSAGGPSSVSPVETEVSAGATSARDNATAEHVYDPLTAPERARRSNARVYQSSHARKRAAKTAETAAAITEPEIPRRLGTHSASTAGPSRVRDPPPKERVKKNSRK